MSDHDDCVLWTLVAVSGRPVVCNVVAGNEGLALTIEYGDDIMLAEMMVNLDAAICRAEGVRRTLLAMGFKDASRE